MKYLVLLVLGLLVGCESKTDSTPAQEPNNVSENNDNADLVALRQAVVENHAAYIHETLSEFETQSEELQSAVNAWQASGSASDLESAISEFHEAMDVWQRAEVLQVGPAGVMGAVAGGEDLRDQIYSWPLSNACRVDQELVRLGYESDFASQAVNVRGLDALEYLLFAEDTSNACPINSMINTDGQWAALGEEEIRERRRAYAKAVTDLVVTSAEDLSARWAEGGSFRAQFTDPSSGQVYGSVREVLNGVSDAMFYVEKEVKDMKLAPPLGVVGCASETCPELIESKYGERSLRNIRQNLVTFQWLFTGGEGSGFDDLLEAVGAEETRDELQNDIQMSIDLVDAVEGEFAPTLENEPAKLQAIYDQTRNISTVLKTDFVTLLDLDLPKRAEGDND